MKHTRTQLLPHSCTHNLECVAYTMYAQAYIIILLSPQVHRMETGAGLGMDAACAAFGS